MLPPPHPSLPPPPLSTFSSSQFEVLLLISVSCRFRCLFQLVISVFLLGFSFCRARHKYFRKKAEQRKLNKKKFRKLKWAIFFDDVLEFKQQKKTFFFSIFQISPNDCIIDFVRCLVLQFKSIEFLFSFSSLEN